MVLGVAPTTLPLTDARIWVFPVAAMLVGIVILFAAFGNRRSLARRSSTKWGKRLLSSITSIAAICVAIACAFIDFPQVIENGATTMTALFASLIVFFFSVGACCHLVLWYVDDENEAELAKVSELTRLVQADERRREEIAEIVGSKARLVRAAVKQDAPINLTPDFLLKTVQPKQQLLLNFVALHRSLRKLIGQSGSLRLAVLFVNADGAALSVSFSFDGIHDDCITTPNKKHAKHFLLNGTKSKCFAVNAAIEGGLFVIPDTTRLSKEERACFEFFDDRQKKQIKSISAYGYSSDDAGPRAVITADSNRKNAFKTDPTHMKLLETEFSEFGRRLLFEADIYNLLTSRGTSDARNSDHIDGNSTSRQ